MTLDVLELTQPDEQSRHGDYRDDIDKPVVEQVLCDFVGAHIHEADDDETAKPRIPINGRHRSNLSDLRIVLHVANVTGASR